MEYTFKTDLVCIKSGSTMKMAKALMSEKRIRHLPVINSENQIISILSKHDLTDALKLQELPVDFFANSPVIYVTEDTDMKTVALKMIEEKISSVLLTDNNKTVIGIITTNDLLFHLAHLLDENAKKSQTSTTHASTLMSIGEFFRKLSDIGI